ncbi:MAG: sugar kinase [Thermodesulfobacteria bacterium]|nr:sugar kinase [Thermodesulfobacteriota bacterium]
MLLLAGSVPVDKLPLHMGPIRISDDAVEIGDARLEINRGNEAMMTAACHACDYMGLDAPVGLVAGDIGKREGSEAIYHYLIENLPQMNVDVLTMHYVMPDINLNKQVMASVDKMAKRPILIADAGSMYVAKAGGIATKYDVFTPDLGELAFLADEKADHPAFTRGSIFHMEDNVVELIKRAYETGNAPATMFVKGSVDYICHNGEIVATIDSPSVETMEPIGGTGDLITGMISGLIYAGKDPVEACILAGRANRRAGELANPTPATQISEILKFLPQALKEIVEASE